MNKTKQGNDMGLAGPMIPDEVVLVQHVPSGAWMDFSVALETGAFALNAPAGDPSTLGVACFPDEAAADNLVRIVTGSGLKEDEVKFHYMSMEIAMNLVRNELPPSYTCIGYNRGNAVDFQLKFVR